MASEHEHRWMTYRKFGEPIGRQHRVCRICGKDEVYDVPEEVMNDDLRIEHHFSDRYMAAVKRFGMKQNEEMIELLMEQNEQLEQQLAQARALLAGLADDLNLEAPDNPGSLAAYKWLAEHPKA